MPWFPIRHFRRNNNETLPDGSDEDNLMKIDGQHSAEVAIVENDEVEIV